MDLKQNGIAYMTGVHENPNHHHHPLKVQIPSSRTAPFLGIPRLNEDSFKIIDGCGDDQSGPYEAYNHNSNFRNCLRVHPVTTLDRRLSALDSKENFSRFPLHLPDEFIQREIDEYNEPWLASVDVFRERMRKQHLLRHKPRSSFTRYRYSESEKDSSLRVDSVDPVKRRIRARSESEPNDICGMRRWTPPHDLELQQNNQNNKRPREDQNSIQKNRIQPSIHRKESVQPLMQLKKKDSPPRMLVYNNSPQPRSPAQLKKPTRYRASPVLGSPRLNNVRRSKTKSSSPIASRTQPVTSSSNQSFRKSKSATPPPRNTLTPVPSSTKTSYHSSEASFTGNSDSECSTIGDDEDDADDFDGDLSDNGDENSSSDSEYGYKTNVYAQNDKINSPLSEIDRLDLKGQQTTHFVASLFPHVPPYLSFCSHIDKRPSMPPYLFKILKWRLTSVMPKVIRRVLINSGFRLLKKTNDWMGTWGKHMKSPCFKTVRSYQKFNHIPGSFKIGRKDSCWRNLQAQMIKHGKKEFGFMPKTYIIPQDLKVLRKSWPKYSQRNFKWIIKPPASARGTGIKVINRWSQIPKRKPIIVQRYIERPLLINGSKFDLRLYVLVTSINPLRVYMYQDGLARFASVKYSEKSDTLNDRYMHLTNYSINKLSSTYSQNEDVNACKGHKWTIRSLWTYLKGRGINTNKLWEALRNLVLRTLLAGESSINAMMKLNVESKYNCFELFGFDVILDSDLVPWLLEVNISPSLHSELPLDLHVKGPLVQAVLNTAMYHVPPKLSSEQQKEILTQEGLSGPLCYDKRMYVTHLSRAEKIKHNQFTRKSLEDRNDYLNPILENLTPDDIRCLIVSEDELQRSAPLERIFPGPTTHKYLKYTELPRYYNRLLDAWENRYGCNRREGIQLLQELCEQKQHLEVAPQPVKKPIKIRTRTLRMTTRTSSWALKTAVNSIKRRNKKRNERLYALKQKEEQQPQQPQQPLQQTAT